MWLILFWLIFIVIMGVSVLNREIDTFHYLLFGLVMLYIHWLHNQIK